MGRLKALLHQCVCELLAGAAMLVLVLACWWQYRLCFLVHGLSPTPGLPLPPAWQTVQITGSVFPIFQIYDQPDCRILRAICLFWCFQLPKKNLLLRVYSVVPRPPYTHTHMPRVTLGRYRGKCSIRPRSQLRLVVELAALVA